MQHKQLGQYMFLLSDARAPPFAVLLTLFYGFLLPHFKHSQLA
jgi:hypothetical protein